MCYYIITSNRCSENVWLFEMMFYFCRVWVFIANYQNISFDIVKGCRIFGTGRFFIPIKSNICFSRGVFRMIRREKCVCPVCGDEVMSEEIERFDMCLDCFADSISSEVTESVLFDFLREYGREFREFIRENYEY